MNDTAAAIPAPGHTPHLAHHFHSRAQQYQSGKLGMWLFLATEILLFGGLFCAYAVYRANHPEIFIYAHQFLDKTLGAINTVVLIASSFTMAWAVRCAQRNRRTGLIVNLALTLLGGAIFMGVKYIEYKHKWEHGLLWGARYQPRHPGHTPADPTATGAHLTTGSAAALTTTTIGTTPAGDRSRIAPAAVGPRGLASPDSRTVATHPDEPRRVHIFFGIYFAMTGLHGLHVLAGMVVITWLLARAVAGHFSAAYYTPLDLGGLYWHLVDLIWIYLFPLLYLIH